MIKLLTLPDWLAAAERHRVCGPLLVVAGWWEGVTAADALFLDEAKTRLSICCPPVCGVFSALAPRPSLLPTFLGCLVLSDSAAAEQIGRQPLLSAPQRAALVAAVFCVDAVAIVPPDDSAAAVISGLAPDHYDWQRLTYCPDNPHHARL